MNANKGLIVTAKGTRSCGGCHHKIVKGEVHFSNSKWAGTSVINICITCLGEYYAEIAKEPLPVPKGMTVGKYIKKAVETFKPEDIIKACLMHVRDKGGANG